MRGKCLFESLYFLSKFSASLKVNCFEIPHYAYPRPLVAIKKTTLYGEIKSVFGKTN